MLCTQNTPQQQLNKNTKPHNRHVTLISAPSNSVVTAFERIPPLLPRRQNRLALEQPARRWKTRHRLRMHQSQAYSFRMVCAETSPSTQSSTDHQNRQCTCRIDGTELYDVRTDTETWTTILKKTLSGKPHPGITTTTKQASKPSSKPKPKQANIYILEEGGKNIAKHHTRKRTHSSF